MSSFSLSKSCLRLYFYSVHTNPDWVALPAFPRVFGQHAIPGFTVTTRTVRDKKFNFLFILAVQSRSKKTMCSQVNTGLKSEGLRSLGNKLKWHPWPLEVTKPHTALNIFLFLSISVTIILRDHHILYSDVSDHRWCFLCQHNKINTEHISIQTSL